MAKRNGRNVKDMNEEGKKNCCDMYMPPGIIKAKPTKMNVASKLPGAIKKAVPNENIYIRQVKDTRMSGFGNLGENAVQLAKQTGMFPQKS